MLCSFNEEVDAILKERFGKDSLIALATVSDGSPHVRTVDAVYMDGSFYVVTYALSGKMRQIAREPRVAIAGEWFTAHGTGEDRGHVLLPGMRRSWRCFGKPSPLGMTTVIPMKRIRIHAC